MTFPCRQTDMVFGRWVVCSAPKCRRGSGDLGCDHGDLLVVMTQSVSHFVMICGGFENLMWLDAKACFVCLISSLWDESYWR